MITMNMMLKNNRRHRLHNMRRHRFLRQIMLIQNGNVLINNTLLQLFKSKGFDNTVICLEQFAQPLLMLDHISEQKCLLFQLQPIIILKINQYRNRQFPAILHIQCRHIVFEQSLHLDGRFNAQLIPLMVDRILLLTENQQMQDC